MTSIRYARAYGHVYNVCQQGQVVTLIKATSVDEMGSALAEDDLVLHSFPVRFNPFDRDVYQKIAWAEECDVICYVAKKEIDLSEKTLLQLQKKYRVLRHGSKNYDVKYIEYYSAFGGDFLYVIIGGKK